MMNFSSLSPVLAIAVMELWAVREAAERVPEFSGCTTDASISFVKDVFGPGS
jgi:hypothetical protein